MTKSNKRFIEVDDVDSFDYEKTKNNVDLLYRKYRNFKNKYDILTKRYNSSLSFDHLGICTRGPGDPTGKKVEQNEKFEKFVNTIDEIYSLYCDELSEDEKIVYKNCLVTKHTDDDLMELLCMSHGAAFLRKRSCYLKVAKWFDLEVYK